MGSRVLDHLRSVYPACSVYRRICRSWLLNSAICIHLMDSRVLDHLRSVHSAYSWWLYNNTCLLRESRLQKNPPCNVGDFSHVYVGFVGRRCTSGGDYAGVDVGY
jgi:hypothetical protein